MAPLLEATPEPLLHGVTGDAATRAPEGLRRVYPAGDQWYWRADFVKEIPDEAVRPMPSSAPSCRPEVDHAPVPDRRSRPRRRAHRHRVGYRDANWGSVFAGVDPDPANADSDP